MRRADTFLASTVGRKVVMAVTGVILFGFICVHLIGNLQVYIPPHDGHVAINDYGHFLKTFLHGAGIWIFRAVIITCVVLHGWAAVTLALENWRARPVGYRKNLWRQSTYASRTMVWGGPIIFLFLLYHLLHLTFGTLYPRLFIEDNVYHNIIAGFQIVPVSIVYIAAMLVLGLHLYHGVWSMLQTLGLSHPRYNPLRKAFATAFAIIIVAGNISFPLMVLAGRLVERS